LKDLEEELEGVEDKGKYEEEKKEEEKGEEVKGEEVKGEEENGDVKENRYSNAWQYVDPDTNKEESPTGPTDNNRTTSTETQTTTNTENTSTNTDNTTTTTTSTTTSATTTTPTPITTTTTPTPTTTTTTTTTTADANTAAANVTAAISEPASKEATTIYEASGVDAKNASISKELTVTKLFEKDLKGAHLVEILQSLQTLTWKRYDVYFDKWYLFTSSQPKNLADQCLVGSFWRILMWWLRECGSMPLDLMLSGTSWITSHLDHSWQP
jgi:hypothetical protein